MGRKYRYVINEETGKPERVWTRPKNCVGCNIEFIPNRKDQIYCRSSCRTDKHRLPTLGKQFGIPAGTVGAISELRVSTDLMSKGFHVFRALSPCCPCDLIAFKAGGPVLKIEVASATERNGKIYAPRKDETLSDVRAFATLSTVYYTPELDEAIAKKRV